MGEAKRRKIALGEKYGKESQLFSWLPISKSQSQKWAKWVNRGTKFGIGFLVVWWITIRFIGPAFGWWQVV